MKSFGRQKAVKSTGTPPAELPIAGWRELLKWGLRRRVRYQVSGRSMVPILIPGDEVLVHPRARLRVGDVVVAYHPYRAETLLIKEVSEIDGHGRLYLVGVNPKESTDSRTLGALPPHSIIGRVTSRFER